MTAKFLLAFYFLLGLIFGSFCNVLVDRGQKMKKITGRSRCDFCGYKLRWFDNLPVASFLALGGKCRKCGGKLSWQYPLVELGMGVLFVAAVWSAGFFDGPISVESVAKASYFAAISFVLFAILIRDLKYMVIPDGLIIGGSIVAVAYLFYDQLSSSCFFLSPNCPLISGLIGGVIIFGFFWLLYFFSKGKWIGGGDVKLGFLIGLIAGWKQAYLLLLLAYVAGAAVALILIFSGKKKLQSKIPFGPFLAIAALATLFFGEKLLQWYWNVL